MQVFNQQSGGEDCISCCPVEIPDGCQVPDCIHLFTTYALNCNKNEYTGRLSQEVFKAAISLTGLVYYGSKEQPYVDGVPQNDYGRSLIHSAINNWDWQAGDVRVYLQEIYRVLVPFHDDFIKQCGCDESNENRIDCTALNKIMDSIFEFIQIGLTGRPPFTLDEWQSALCGVCYTDCDGNDIVPNS